MITLGRMVILVKEYKEALDFYVGKIGCDIAADIDAGTRRFVHLTFPSQPGVGIWLLKAETEADIARIGRQTGDQPCGVLYTENIHSVYETLTGSGVDFLEAPVERDGAISAHFSDLYGNKFVLVQLVP